MQRALILLLVLPGCYESFERSPSGDGGIVLFDSGSPGDAGRRPDARPDSSNPPCAVGEVVPPYAGPGCAASTRACVEACAGDPACTDACLAGDLECARCVNTTLITCGNELGCQPQWDAFACCADRECPGTAPGVGRLECLLAGLCQAEIDAFGACLSTDPAFCDMELQACFSP